MSPLLRTDTTLQHCPRGITVSVTVKGERGIDTKYVDGL